MDKCPKCGGTNGWSAHDYFAGWGECLGDWACTDSDYPQFSDTVIIRKYSRTVICLDCGKRIEFNRAG